jgi:hypothetical protein
MGWWGGTERGERAWLQRGVGGEERDGVMSLRRLVKAIEATPEPLSAEHRKENPWVVRMSGGSCCVVA